MTRKISMPAGAIRFAGLFMALLMAVAFVRPAMAEGDGIAPDYRIAAEDLLNIQVWKEPDLSRDVVVRPDGGFSFPLIGDVDAAGATTAELEATLKDRLGAFVPDAVVTVSVKELRGLRIYVTGKVRSPGQYQVGRYVDVLQAITLAGGFTPFADTKDVQIIRRDAVGKETVYRFNYKQVERGKNMSQNIRLQADDLILVP